MHCDRRFRSFIRRIIPLGSRISCAFVSERAAYPLKRPLYIRCSVYLRVASSLDHLSIYLSVYLSTYLPTYLPTYLLTYSRESICATCPVSVTFCVPAAPRQVSRAPNIKVLILQNYTNCYTCTRWAKFSIRYRYARKSVTLRISVVTDRWEKWFSIRVWRN